MSTGDPRDWGCTCSGPFDTITEQRRAERDCPYHKKLQKHVYSNPTIDGYGSQEMKG